MAGHSERRKGALYIKPRCAVSGMPDTCERYQSSKVSCLCIPAIARWSPSTSERDCAAANRRENGRRQEERWSGRLVTLEAPEKHSLRGDRPMILLPSCSSSEWCARKREKEGKRKKIKQFKRQCSIREISFNGTQISTRNNELYSPYLLVFSRF